MEFSLLKFWFLVFSLGFIFYFIFPSWSYVLIPLSGRVTDYGFELPDGNLRFYIYDSNEGGNLIWDSTITTMEP